MQPVSETSPTSEEMTEFSITAFKGIDAGLGKEDPGMVMAKKLEEQYPNHLVLIQAGNFLHAYGRSAHLLSTMKNYRLKLVGTTNDPNIRVGFPISNFKKRLWSIVSEFGTPYVAAVGSKVMGFTVFVSDQHASESSLLKVIQHDIVDQIIGDLQQHGAINVASAKKLLANPETNGFKLKSQAQDLDTQLLQDILKMPRDLRETFGQNLRECMGRLMPAIFAYGAAPNKDEVLRDISTEVDLIKHYLTQGQRLNRLKISFEHRAGLAVELGRLVGGLIRSNTRPA